MENLIEELKSVVPFKQSTDVGDIVLIVGDIPEMIIYALVQTIERDSNKKDEWWNIGLTFLTVPLQNVLWTLRTAQMTGQEIFTMGGEKRFFQAVELERKTPDSTPDFNSSGRSPKTTLKRIK